MNARLYDPRIARFFSPDNFITDPENPQNYNRYSYALNNPLKYTDPTGNYLEWTEPFDGSTMISPPQRGGMNLSILNDIFSSLCRMGSMSLVDYNKLDFALATGTFTSFTSEYLYSGGGGGGGGSSPPDPEKKEEEKKEEEKKEGEESGEKVSSEEANPYDSFKSACERFKDKYLTKGKKLLLPLIGIRQTSVTNCGAACYATYEASNGNTPDISFLTSYFSKFNKTDKRSSDAIHFEDFYNAARILNPSLKSRINYVGAVAPGFLSAWIEADCYILAGIRGSHMVLIYGYEVVDDLHNINYYYWDPEYGERTGNYGIFDILPNGYTGISLPKK